jgi:hypothetical protein
MCGRKQEVLISALERGWLIAGALKQGNSLDRMDSVGVEVDRLDDYSDLDFFGVVEPDFKNEFLGRTMAHGFAEGLTPRRIENVVGSAKAS